MDTEVTCAPPDVRAKIPAPELEDKLTVRPRRIGIAKGVLLLNGDEAQRRAVADAVPVTGDVVKTTLAGGAVVMV